MKSVYANVIFFLKKKNIIKLNYFSFNIHEINKKRGPGTLSPDFHPSIEPLPP